MKIEVKSGIVVWVDVDEVLVDFRNFFHEFLNNKYKMNIPRGYLPKDWHYQEIFPKKIDFDNAFNSLPNNWPSLLKAFPNAKEFTKQLKDLGCRVVLITHIPSEKAPDRLVNLNQHQIYFDEAYFTWGRNKGDYSSQIVQRYVQEKTLAPAKNLFIDDKAANVKEFLEVMPNMDYAVTLDLDYNYPVLDEMKLKYSESNFSYNNKDQDDMYSKIIQRILSLKKERD